MGKRAIALKLLWEKRAIAYLIEGAIAFIVLGKGVGEAYWSVKTKIVCCLTLKTLF